MPLNAKKAATNAAHMAKLDMIRLQPYKAEGAAIRAAASAAGQSLQGYVLQAVRERMTAEGQRSRWSRRRKAGKKGDYRGLLGRAIAY